MNERITLRKNWYEWINKERMNVNESMKKELIWMNQWRKNECE